MKELKYRCRAFQTRVGCIHRWSVLLSCSSDRLAGRRRTKKHKVGHPALSYPHTAINAIDASFISIEVSQVRACTSIYKASTQRSISDSDDRLCVLASAIECLYSYGSIVLVYICNFRETERDCIAFQHIEPQDSKDKYSVETRTVRS